MCLIKGNSFLFKINQCDFSIRRNQPVEFVRFASFFNPFPYLFLKERVKNRGTVRAKRKHACALLRNGRAP